MVDIFVFEEVFSVVEEPNSGENVFTTEPSRNGYDGKRGAKMAFDIDILKL